MLVFVGKCWSFLIKDSINTHERGSNSGKNVFANKIILLFKLVLKIMSSRLTY